MTIDTYILFVDVITPSSSSMPGATTSRTAALPLTMPADPSPQLSPLAQVLAELERLQQQNPAEYEQVTQQIATSLQSAAQSAQAAGNSTAANQLNQLATDFTNALQSGQMPDIQNVFQVGSGDITSYIDHVDLSSADSD
jgi:hypothetical protein